MKLRLTLSIAFAALWPALAAGQGAPRSDAVLSLVGDALTVVTYQPLTGHMVDQNRRDVMLLPDPVLDRDVLTTIDQTIRAADRSAAPVLLAIPAASLPQDQATLFDNSHFQPAEGIARALKASGGRRHRAAVAPGVAPGPARTARILKRPSTRFAAPIIER